MPASKQDGVPLPSPFPQAGGGSHFGKLGITMLNLIKHDAITEIQFARPPVNALNLDLLRAVQGAIADAVREGARGILAGVFPDRVQAGDVAGAGGRCHHRT